MSYHEDNVRLLLTLYKPAHAVASLVVITLHPHVNMLKPKSASDCAASSFYLVPQTPPDCFTCCTTTIILAALK